MTLGNPAVAIAAQGALKTVRNVLTDKRVIYVILGIILYFILKKTFLKAIRAYKEKQFDKNSFASPNKIALNLHSAANPSGQSWIIDYDGTDEDAFLTSGQRMKDLRLQREVSEAYQLKFDETLEDRANKELDGDDLRTWEGLID